MAGDAGTRSLEFTPTWAVAAVCTMFVVVSLVGERSLHHLSHWLSRTKRKPLAAALEKMKEELMLLGFISLVITVTAPYISKVCIKSSFYDKQRMPCSLSSKPGYDSEETEKKYFANSFKHVLLSSHGRQLAAVQASCPEKHEPFVSFLGLEQLHRFLFVMALTHVFYSCLTMLLAIMKVYSWIKWEEEAHEHADNQTTLAEMTRTLTIKRQSTFAAHHSAMAWNKRSKVFLWAICFFRQFGLSVTKADYLALRMGFIKKHNTRPKYDFHDYMIRSMEDEFKDIVGISALFWLFVVCFMLFNVDGSNLYFYMSFLPIALVLLVGAKLQYVIATLAIEDTGMSALQPRDNLFWFKKPRLLLHLIHFILFQDAFELATFFWVWWQFGWESCYMSRKLYAYVRVFTGLLVQIFCSYSTLPLYALVTQMGSNYKKAIFQEGIVDSIHHWKMAAKKRAKGSVQDSSSIHSNITESKQDGFTTLDLSRVAEDDELEKSKQAFVFGYDDSNLNSNPHQEQGEVEEEIEMSRQGFVFPAGSTAANNPASSLYRTR